MITGVGNFEDILSDIDGNWAKITFTGKLSKTKLEELYKSSTIGVIPSLCEQCSYVAIEMMKHGLPIVAAAAPGLKELFINRENALIVPLHMICDVPKRLELHVDELAETIEILLTDKTLRQKLSNKARLSWEQCFTNIHMGKDTLKVYKQLLKIYKTKINPKL